MKVHLFKKLKKSLQIFIDNTWYNKSVMALLLWPLSVLFRVIIWARRKYLQKFNQKLFSVPIIIVGNITVGGVGKTPLVIAISEKLTQAGFKVGIVSRGYKAHITNFPYMVKTSDEASLVGDEPLLLALRSNCPVVIDPDRCRAVAYIIEKCKPDIIISDDGLQHYKLGRTIEIAVIDGSRGHGNGFCLPAGPLREPQKRLEEVDFVIINGKGCSEQKLSNTYKMFLHPQELRSCISNQILQFKEISSQVVAVAAIGNPGRFFKTLKSLGFESDNQTYPDHYAFTKEDFSGISKLIVMTEKDYVKCKSFADERMFFLPVEAILSDDFWDKLMLICRQAIEDQVANSFKSL